MPRTSVRKRSISRWRRTTPSACSRPLVREGDRLVGGAGDVAVALEAPDHLVHGRRGQLHRARHVGARHRQPGLLEPEDGLEVLLLGDGRVVVGHAVIVSPRPCWIGCDATTRPRDRRLARGSGGRSRRRSRPAARRSGWPPAARRSSRRSRPARAARDRAAVRRRRRRAATRGRRRASPPRPAGSTSRSPTPASPTTAASWTRTSSCTSG